MDIAQSITWLGHASFRIKDQTTGNLIYYIDPFDFRLSEYEKADIIFITHAHFDHCSKGDVNKIIKQDTVIVAPPDCFKNLGLAVQYEKKEVVPNENYEVRNVVFRTVPAYNTYPEKLDKHPRINNWVGYVITANGIKIYHAGDTDFTEEMTSLGPIDVVMLPMGGTFTMDVNDAIKATNIIAAKVAIPMHYKMILGEGYLKAEEKFKAGVTNSKVVILKELQ